jgi:[ribosomal protein S5]-alanine N-acetyltransferase
MVRLPLVLPSTLVDGDLTLRAPRLEDAETHRLAEDDEMRRRFDSRRLPTAEEMRFAFQHWINAWEASAPSRTYLAFCAGAQIGGVQLRRTRLERGELSWWTYAVHRRAGLATRAARLLCDAAGAVEGLAELHAHIDPDNLASRRLAERIGFVEAAMVDDTARDGAVVTRVLYTRAVRAPARTAGLPAAHSGPSA